MTFMRILYVINSLEFGGAEVRTVSLVNGLDRKRFEPYVVYLRGPGPLLRGLKAEAISLDAEVKSVRDVPAAAFRLRKVICRVAPVIVHTHLVQAGLVGRLAGRACHVPVVVSTQHNAYYPKQNTLLYR